MDKPFTLHLGDCLEALRAMPDNSIDSIVTDPPYGLAFMGKKWDYDVPSVEIWAECLRVLKPGGHLLAFAGTRTQHRMAVRIEDAGFEIRDMIAWVYGSGFPKSLDVSKAIDKAAGAEREVLGTIDPRSAFDGRERTSAAINTNWRSAEGREDVRDLSKKEITAPATDAARQWQGWGTALKPAMELITMARKPFASTVAANVLEHGTGALNIDGCRVGTEDMSGQWDRTWNDNSGEFGERYPQSGREAGKTVPPGRWPANLIHDGSSDVVAAFPDSNGSGPARKLNRSAKPEQQGWGMNTTASDVASLRDAGTGSAARFFYCAKTNKKDRDDGNNHPTVKPTDLMRYLCRLVTPPGGVVLDPFMGSGSTGKAAVLEGFRFIGVECEPAYFEIACRRIEQAHAQGQLFESTQAAPVQRKRGR